MKPLIIYVCGPYTASIYQGIIANVERAQSVGIALMRLGHHIIIPHLSHYLELQACASGSGFSWERWIEADLEILSRCDALFFIGNSRGADLELARAKELGMRVFYSIDEVPEVE